ncbi:cytochrome P450 [Salibacterium qingdaonense]|uniref:Fatty-acid peroxygenase n=1 Tax=Salibacterium qingdaonense TaxID=266892 RepID=A0A1I4KHC8_9BACI|nr:cytochrome P450 [Salibacterium qingdaonense]SFL77876.1 fatty-acid peroxygenase [Salibacterium qingdaonense]
MAYRQIPKEKGLDHTLDLLSEGFHFVPNRRDHLQSNIFQTRLMGKKAICLSGQEAARVFYDNRFFKRKGAAPKRVKKTLFGQNGVQGLDGEDHKHRKRMFLSLMTPDRLQELQTITQRLWAQKAEEWEKGDQVVLFDEAEEIMCRAACEWAGVPLPENEVKQRTTEFSRMIDAFGGTGFRYKKGKKARERSEKWIQQVIKQVRYGEQQPAPYTAAYIIAMHSERNGRKMVAAAAAVELINVLRPIVAIGRFIMFGALALHDYPDLEEKLLNTENEEYSRMFVQELRRYYPFAPFTGAVVRKDFLWNKYRLKKGTLVIMDIYGTNHHPDLWEDPEVFRPERFRGWEGHPFSFIPQGGGDHYTGHRCAGEWITIMLMKTSMEFLTGHMTYQVPEQDLRYDMARMPTLVNSGFIIENVKAR